MKRIAAVLLAVVLAFSMSACGEKVDPEIQKKNEEALAGINKDYIGQYLGDGTYQFEDITYKVNQNWEVKPDAFDLYKQNSFAYLPDGGGYILVMCSIKMEKSDLEEDWDKIKNPEYESKLTFLGEKEINGIQCLEYKYSYVRPDDGQNIFQYDTYIPNGDGMLTLRLSSFDEEVFNKLEKEYIKIVSSIKYEK